MSPVQVRKPRKGDVLELDVERLDDRGFGVGRFKEFTVRVRGAVPGSRIAASVRRRRRNAIEAALDGTLRASSDAVASRCSHFGTCGGCSFQELAYPAQLRELGRIVRELVAPLDAARIDEVVGCADPWHYRNKMDFTFGNRRWIEAREPANAARDFALGLHVPGRFDKVLDVDACEIAFREATPILRSARALALDAGLDAWDTRAHRGLLRHLVLRKGFATGEIMVDLVTTSRDPERIGEYADSLLALHPEITTFVQRVNPGVALVAAGEELVLSGPGAIEERVADLSFRISAASFFQTNTLQAEELVRIVREQVAPRRGQLVFDLYCGTGLFALAMARDGARVVGFELVPEAIEDAHRAARTNRIEGVELVAGDLAHTIADAARAGESPDVCVLDPPRAGMHARVLEGVRELRARRIVYVSCNPVSAVRDIELLASDGYRIERVQPVDLFPHTPHLECVFTLERASPLAGSVPSG